MGSITRRRLAVAGIALLSAGVIAYAAIAYQIAAGVTKAERKPQEDTPQAHGLAYQDVSFPSREKGISLNGWYITKDPTRPAIIFVHGIDSQRADDNSVSLANELSRRGFQVLMFDLRGHGTSGEGRISAGYFERQDVLGAFDYLKAQGTPADRIGLLGFSMGAAIALMSAADESQLRAVVADSTFANASELIAQEVDRKTPFPEPVVPLFIPGAKLLAKVIYGIDVDALVPERSVSAIGYPIYQMHGDADTRIPLAHSVRVHEAAPLRSVLWVASGSEHVKAFTDYPGEYVDRVSGYYAERLGAPWLPSDAGAMSMIAAP